MFICKKNLAALILAVGLLYPLLTRAQCHPSSDLSIMDRDFLSFLKKTISSKNDKIAILPFYENKGGRSDQAFSNGIPFVIFDALESTSPAIMHPYLSLEAVKRLGISGEALTQRGSLETLAKELEAPFLIFGSYQITHRGTVRAIVNVFNSKSKKTLSPAQDFETPFDDSFFMHLIDSVKLAFASERSLPKLKPSDTRPPSMQVFREYAQGLEYAQKYNSNTLNLAAVWLSKAHNESYKKYNAAGIELARVYFMQGLILKNSQKDFTQPWLKARQVMENFTEPLSAKSLKHNTVQRFLNLETLSIKATTAYLQKENSDAHFFAKEAIVLVPEDGMMQNLFLVTGNGKPEKDVKVDNAVCF